MQAVEEPGYILGLSMQAAARSANNFRIQPQTLGDIRVAKRERAAHLPVNLPHD